ncbi:uncharacterized protein Fot_00957 [Forsythia ovata]|uniref:Uncharacterized protein n=1 Tax=Forsythia ovata TaxID=205694 RepID=A0ABD1X5S4_9LAMI
MEIELVVVGGGDEEEIRTDLKEMMSMRSSRRHVLEDIEIKDDKIEEEAGKDANAASKQEDADKGGENINKEIEDIEEQLHVQECEVADEMDNEILQVNVGVSIEQEIPAEAESKVPQNDLLL